MSNYIIDNTKYFDYKKNAFQTIKNENIYIGENIILEFHILARKRLLVNYLNWTQKGIEEELIKIKSEINKFNDLS